MRFPSRRAHEKLPRSEAQLTHAVGLVVNGSPIVRTTIPLSLDNGGTRAQGQHSCRYVKAFYPRTGCDETSLRPALPVNPPPRYARRDCASPPYPLPSGCRCAVAGHHWCANLLHLEPVLLLYLVTFSRDPSQPLRTSASSARRRAATRGFCKWCPIRMISH